MNTKELFDKILGQITVYPDHEAREIVFWLIEFYLGLKKVDVLMNKKAHTLQEEEFWDKIIFRINNHEPIQYIIGETDFYGRKFLVNSSVLIPRPETEELIDLVLNSLKKHENLSILDIGTGSGCIAITLAKELKNSKVTAYDISEKALETAQKNAELNKIEVHFEKMNILEESNNQQQTDNKKYDIIVSNPPYVTKNEAHQMRQNVLDFEPHLALFVEDDNALIFYEAITRFAMQHLKKYGFIVVEINEALGSEIAEVFYKNGFTNTEIVKDIFQKERFVKASLS
jgi:release factor glutamine methyltransferase